MIYKKASENLTSFRNLVMKHTGKASSDAVLLRTMQMSDDSFLSELPEGTIRSFLEAFCVTLKVAIFALDQQHEMTFPEPLSLDELKEMIGEPVWIEYRDLNHRGWTILTETTFCTLGGYGETCLAYRYKPVNREVHTDES